MNQKGKPLGRVGLLPVLIVALALSSAVAHAQGSITNGATHTGIILPAGVDTWTFDAALNDSITIRIGETPPAGTDPLFSPRIRLLSPANLSLGDSAGTNAAEIDVRAPQAGTYTVLVSHSPAATSQVGPAGYILTVAKSPGPFAVTPGDEGGAMTNGATHAGLIQVGDLDAYSFQATLNDSITLRIGEVLGAGVDPVFTPRIRLRGPDGAPLGDSAGVNAAEIDVRAAVTGTYTVLVSHSTSASSQAGTASYVLTLARTAGPYTVTAGDEGGPVTNGATHTGLMPIGDLDVWTFDATLNDSITLRIGKVLGAGVDPVFTPRIRLRGPGGASLGDSAGTNAAEIDVRAPATGVYTVLVSHSTSASSQVGTASYAMTVARTAGPYTVTPGDEGGAVTNGATHTGLIPIGDLDVWSFQASVNDSITLRIGEVLGAGVDPVFTPRIRLRGPDGAPVGDSAGTNAAEIDVRAAVTGTYTVLVSHSTSASSQVGTGSYVLTVARTAGPYTVSPGDEGGPVTNGATHTGLIPIGDLDVWTFEATLNDSITLRIGEVLGAGVDPVFTPRIRLRGPGGAPLGDSTGTNAGEIDTRAPATGVYTVLVSHSTSASSQVGTGSYVLTVARTAGPYTVTAGDEGGLITDAAPHAGIIPIGDLDPYTFQAAANESITVRVAEVVAGVDPVFTPRIRLRGPDGAPLGDSTGTTATEFSVRVPVAGTYTVLVSHSTAASSQVAAGSYVLTISRTPSITLDRTSLQFAATSSGAAFVHQTLPQTVRLLQSGAGTITWTATPTQPWITVTPASGTGSATLTVGITFVPGIPVSGISNGSVALAFTGASSSGTPIAVGLKTMPNGASASPFGIFDTPTDGSTGVTGSIAVTGWALDDIDVRAVHIVRDRVALDPPGPDLIPIGDVVFIDGARPDVATGFAGSPRSTRAGWGYMLLTNFLPNKGNGTFRLHAIAEDAEGHTFDLGTKIITCANATATRPFGAIDTPAQGEVISGAAYSNFGWVLARGPALAYPPFGTVQVLIDGLPAGTPGGWVARPDLTALFPALTYPGVTNALAVRSIDTTTLTNGVHTIAWVVTADNGKVDGVGSRFFTVANGQAGAALTTDAAEPATLMQSVAGALVPPDELNAVPLDRTVMTARRGYDASAAFAAVAVSASGRATIQGEELDRIEMRLGGARGHEYTGFMRVGSELAPLPIGSNLDRTTGVFTWQPGVGFVRNYDLVFLRSVNGHAVSRREVRVVLNPKGSNRTGPQVVIDAPATQAEVAQPFVVAGWALDPDGEVKTGVDTLHVWAYPAGGGSPVFLGAAAYGGARPDVAALFGARFRASGFGLTVDSLPPGTYDLAVFAWSTVENGFVPARVVRVTVR